MDARLYDVGRETEHVDIALVVQDHARGSVEQHQALRHVVERGVELLLLRLPALLRFPALSKHLTDDHDQNQRNHQRGQRGGADHEPGLCAPIGQRGR